MWLKKNHLAFCPGQALYLVFHTICQCSKRIQRISQTIGWATTIKAARSINEARIIATTWEPASGEKNITPINPISTKSREKKSKCFPFLFWWVQIPWLENGKFSGEGDPGFFLTELYDGQRSSAQRQSKPIETEVFLPIGKSGVQKKWISCRGVS